MTTKTEDVARQCPACGAKITRPELSLCSYCGSPIDLLSKEAPKKDGEESVTMRRLAKMAEHKLYAPAMAWDPPESASVRAAQTGRRRGLALFVVGLLLALLTFTRASEGWNLPNVLALVGAGAMAVVGSLRALQGTRRIAEGLTLPLMKRPALVKDRRSETAIHGSKGFTVYTFTLEFDDGSVGDFRFPGRGTSYDPMAQGATGIAFTRGADLLAFKPIRV